MATSYGKWFVINGKPDVTVMVPANEPCKVKIKRRAGVPDRLYIRTSASTTEHYIEVVMIDGRKLGLPWPPHGIGHNSNLRALKT